MGRKLASGELVTTVEILPPKGWNPAEMIEQCRALQEAGVDAVNILDSARAQSRMGVLPAALIVQREVGLETVFHYTCRDRNMLGMLSDLLGAAAGGLRNVLIVTGDPPAMGPYPDSTAVFDIDSIGLTNLVRRLNQGLDPGGNPIGEPTRFVVGVALNQGADLEHELERFAWKVEAGADFAVTQPVFDAGQLERFLGRVRARIPIIAGIWPLTSLRNAEFLANEVPGVHVPHAVIERMRLAQEQGTAGGPGRGGRHSGGDGRGGQGSGARCTGHGARPVASAPLSMVACGRTLRSSVHCYVHCSRFVQTAPMPVPRIHLLEAEIAQIDLVRPYLAERAHRFRADLLRR